MSYQVSRLPANDKTDQHLHQMELNFAPEVIGGFIDIALQTVEDQGKATAPVLSGATRDSIIHYMIDVLSGECIVGVPYALPIEYGYMSRGGKRVPGKNYFRPAARNGYDLLKKMLKDFIAMNAAGITPTPTHRAVAGGGGERAHKYQYKRISTTGKSTYYYTPGAQGRFTTPLRRGPGKSQPSFARVRGGRTPRRF